MADKQDVTGVWYGRYEADQWDERNGFIALLEETGGAVTGTITERDGDGAAEVRRAVVSGHRDGTMLSFVKQYDGTGGHTHAIDYAGRIDAEGIEVSGAWTQVCSSGSFTMEREKFTEEMLEQEEEAELPVIFDSR